jgi:hypothetical protein
MGTVSLAFAERKGTACRSYVRPFLSRPSSCFKFMSQANTWQTCGPVRRHTTSNSQQLHNVTDTHLKDRRNRMWNITVLLSQWYPITVAARSRAWNAFTRSNAGTVGSNPTQGIDVCVGSGLASHWSPVQGVRATLRLAVHRQPVRLGAEPLKTRG